MDCVLFTRPTTAPESFSTGAPLEPFAKSAVICSVFTAPLAVRFTEARPTTPEVTTKYRFSGWLMRVTVEPDGELVERGRGVKSRPSNWRIITSFTGSAASTERTGQT